MTTITLKIDKKTKAGKLLSSMIELLSKDSKGVEIVQTTTKSGLEEALDDIKNNRINVYKDSDDLFKKVLNV
ncbi:hypothetical protein [Flavobacterium tegetincola]|uniref:hypothetical protein n=1 Tax=Flavobacterium tegetincola TaxID=150172 RepID=UPI00040EA1A3|nr:hypothetical protein [Flavobacterium tegetincola]